MNLRSALDLPREYLTTINQAPTPTGADILIVIPCLNEEAHIGNVVRSLQQDSNCRDALIVVADDFSTDQTVAIAKQIGLEDPRVRVLAASKRLGISGLINRAVRTFGQGRTWLIRVDAHAEYPPNYPSRLVKKAIETGATSVVTTMITKGFTCFQRAVAVAQNSFLGTGGARHRVGAAGGWVEHGHHALMDLNLFVAIGGYDESFTHNEDGELDCRILNAGGRIWLADDLTLTYFPRNSTARLFSQYFGYGRGRARTIQRHGNKVLRLRQILPLAIAPAASLIVLSPIWPFALVPLGFWMSVCLLYGITLATSQGICALASGYAAMVMQFAWSTGYWRHLMSGERTTTPPKPLQFFP
jgi:succinoglycan biosynthesis protein ExoA